MPKLSRKISKQNAKDLVVDMASGSDVFENAILHFVVVVAWLIHKTEFTSARSAIAELAPSGVKSASASTLVRYTEAAVDFIKAKWTSQEMFSASTGRSFNMCRQMLEGKGQAGDKKLSKAEIKEHLKNGSIQMDTVREALGREKTVRQGKKNTSTEAPRKTAGAQLVIAVSRVASLFDKSEAGFDQGAEKTIVAELKTLLGCLSQPALKQVELEVARLKTPETVARPKAKARSKAPSKAKAKKTSRRKQRVG